MTHILLPVINKISLLENQPWDQGGGVFLGQTTDRLQL